MSVALSVRSNLGEEGEHEHLPRFEWNANCYSGKNYALSLLMSPAGMVAAYVAILIAMLALYLLAVVAVFAIVIGIFSGG